MTSKVQAAIGNTSMPSGSLVPSAAAASAPAENAPVAGASVVKGGIDIFGPTRIKGWLVDVGEPSKVLTLQIVRGYKVLLEIPADQERADLSSFMPEHNKHGFDATLPPLGIDNPLQVRFVAKDYNFELKLPTAWSPTIVQIDRVNDSLIAGWAWNAFEPDRHIQLRIFHDRDELGYVIANERRLDLAKGGIGGGDHAFIFYVPEDAKVDPLKIVVHPMPLQPMGRPEGGASKVRAGAASSKVVEPAARRAPSDSVVSIKPNWRELASRLFDQNWYAEQHGARIPAEMPPFEHWWNRGRREGLSPHPLFDEAFYRSKLGSRQVKNEDVFLDFVANGSDAEVDPHPCFSMVWYKLRYHSRPVQHPWLDYIEQGGATDRDPNWLFSGRSVTALDLGDRRSDETPLAYFLRRWDSNQVSPHALLDLDFLLLRNADVSRDAAYLSFWQAYRKRDMRTHLYFDPKYYESQAKRSDRRLPALADYILTGESKGYCPIPLFDPSWHKEVYGKSSNFASVLEEFVAVGEKLNRHPCPGFDPRYYLEVNNDVTRAGSPALRHFVVAGQKERRSTHRRFNLSWYANRIATEDRERALEHWLQVGRPAGEAPHPGLVISERVDTIVALNGFLDPQPKKNTVIPGLSVPLTSSGNPQERLQPEVCGPGWLVDLFERSIRTFGSLAARRLKLSEPIVRQYSSFDTDHERAFIKKVVTEFDANAADLPLVSVIIPTRNRVKVLARALRSVLGQTYRNLEVIVIDDGSLDATDKLIERHFSDSRIVYVPIRATGVSGGRNAGLDRARGEYIAYVDSDNYWEPRHIEVVVKAMILGKEKAAYSALRIFNDKGVVRYRGAPFDAPSLRRENYIDMNVYVHHRSVMDRGVRFDETLKRCVDWDFILRASEWVQPVYIPIVGCNYIDDSGALERITTDELSGDFYKVCQRGIDLRPHITGAPPPAPCRASILWPISNEEWKLLDGDLWAAARYIANSPDELIIINNNLSDAATAELATLSRMCSKIRVIHLWRTFHVFPAYNLASTIARAPRLLLWRSGVEFDPNGIEALLAARQNVQTVVVPLVVDGAGRVVSELASAEPTSHLLQPLFSGQNELPTEGVITGVVPVHSPVVIDAALFAELGGFAASYALSFGLAEFCLRLLAKQPRASELHLGCRLRSVQAISGTSGVGEYVKELEALKEAWLAAEVAPLQMPDGFVLKDPRGLRLVNKAWILCPDFGTGRHLSSPTVARAHTFAIRCPAPNTPEKLSWGDYHYALSMIAALEEFGHRGVIEFSDAWDSGKSTGSIVFHIRGIVDTKPVPGAFNAIWVISHPDKVRADELAAMDAVFVAGNEMKRHYAQQHGIAAEVVLQGSDHTRFTGEIQPIGDLSDKALFVGNSRLQMRPIVLDAIEAQLPIVVYGNNWETILPLGFVRGTYLDNEVLANWYGSSGVVLNDHWPTMREYGIISNRIFDVVATGSPVITDSIEGLEPIFGPSVACYQTVEDLSELFHSMAGKRFNDIARSIRSNHTIRSRVEQILRHLDIAKR